MLNNKFENKIQWDADTRIRVLRELTRFGDRLQDLIKLGRIKPQPSLVQIERMVQAALQIAARFRDLDAN